MMRHKAFFFFALILTYIPQNIFARESITAPSGQTIYYYISSSIGGAVVTHPALYGSYSAWSGYEKPEGALIIPDSIYDSATSLMYPVVEIDDNAFAYCSGLTSVSIPKHVVRVDYCAFENCTGLTTVYFNADSCAYNLSAYGGIYYFPFAGCSSLSTVFIGANVKRIPSELFCNCPYLNVYMYPIIAPVLGYNVFGSGFGGSIYIPCGSFDSYYETWAGSYQYNLFEPEVDISVNVTIDNDSIENVYASAIWRGGYVSCIDSTAVVYAYSNNLDYHFDYWSTGSTNERDTIHLNSDTTIIAFFSIDPTLTVIPNNSNMGSVFYQKWNNNHYTYTIWAEENPGYYFDHWSNGDTLNPTSITINEDSVIVAYFSPRQYSLTVLSENDNIGLVYGAGSYYCGDTVTVSAIAIEEHYHFVKWQTNSGNSWDDSYTTIVSTENPYTFVMGPKNKTLMASFAIDTHTVSVVSSDITRGMVEASGTEFVYGTPCTVTATAYTGYTFAGWSNGITANPYTFAVISDVELTALFVEEGEEVYTVTVESADPTMGSVSGGGQALNGGTLTIRAIPNDGYRFLCWNDGNTETPRTVTVTGNITYTAYFESTQGIGDVNATKIKIYTTGGRIVVQGAEGMETKVYDLTGREVVRPNQNGETPVLPSGVYLVKAGTLPARKVVVLR